MTRVSWFLLGMVLSILGGVLTMGCPLESATWRCRTAASGTEICENSYSICEITTSTMTCKEKK